MSDLDYALRIAREGGGPIKPHIKKPHVHKFHVGPIHSSVAGRTDHLPITVESGSYVIPADIISAFGEGNTIAGFKHARRVFGGMPRGQGQQPYNHTGGPYGEGSAPYRQGAIPYGMARGGYADGGAPSENDRLKIRSIKDKPNRLLISATGPGGVKGIVVPRHMWLPNLKAGTLGMNAINKARAAVYGSENRDPLTVGQIGDIHRQALDEHFRMPVAQQIAAEKAALQRLKDAKHISRDANTLDESEKLDTVRHERDEQGRGFVAYGSKGIAGHALYSSGTGANQRLHVINTCPGQTTGCSGGIDENGIVDTSKGTCFAPNAEAQYAGAAIRRACHAQAKHDPAMTRDWVIAHTGSLRRAAEAADKKNLVTLFRPNVVDESDTSTRDVARHLNAQRALKGLPPIIGNSYGKTNELHDPENGWYVTHSNVGPKVKGGTEIRENIGRDKQRVRSTVQAADATGADFRNVQGNLTPPKNSYLVTDVKRHSDLDQRMQSAFKYAKYWSAGRDRLTDAEKAQGPEGHYDNNGNRTTPDKAHYGHTTLNGRRYDYQKQHILHPRMVQVGHNDDGTPHLIPTDSRFLDNNYLPRDRYKTANGKDAGAILMTTPTTSTSNVGHDTAFTHHVDESHIAHAQQNNGEYEIDAPAAQEAARGRPYAEPKALKMVPRIARAGGGRVGDENGPEGHAFPEQSYAAQVHNTHREPAPVSALTTNFAKQLQDHVNAVKQYRALNDDKYADTQNGKVLNVDMARELSPEYRADRTRSNEVHEPASAFVKKMYAERLAEEPKAGEAPFVLFTAGGTGAGKTSAIDKFPTMRHMAKRAQIIYDTNMNKYPSAHEKIEQALGAGKDVHVAYVYRDPEEALTRGALPRAERMGRTVPLETHAETHSGAFESVRNLEAHYRHHPRVKFSIIDNSLGKDKAAMSSMEKLSQKRYNVPVEVLRNALERERQAGRISEATYRGTLGRGPLAAGAGSDGGTAAPDRRDAREHRPGAGGQPQPQDFSAPRLTPSDDPPEPLGTGGSASGVPIVAAGGEYVLSPSQVRGVGNGDLDTGHRVLDRFVKETRAQLIKTLKKLPGPKRD